MSWNIQKPGDYINGPLTVVGVATFNTNVGIGVTPEAWTAFNPVLRIKNASTGGGGALGSTGIDNFRMLTNVYYDGAYKRIGAGYATVYEQASGQHVWYSNGSGAAGSVFSPTNVMVLDASGNLGVGGNGACRVYAQKDGAGGANSNTTGSAFGACHAQASSNDLSFAVRCTGSTLAGIGGQSYATQLITNSANANTFEIYTIGNIPLIFGTAGGERARFNPTGAFVLAGGATAANGIGIAFPSTQSASTDANTLDDYEEGTWTPVVTAATGTLTTVSSQLGYYTKVGRLVTAHCYFVVTTNGTGGSSIQVSGLPFASSNVFNITGIVRLDGVTGHLGQIKFAAGGTVFNVWKYDNSYPAADGSQFPCVVTYFV